MAGELEVTIAASGYIVTIWCTKLDIHFDKLLIPIVMPNFKKAMELGTEPITKIIDIGRVKTSISVQGYLIDETTESGFTKQNTLLNILKFRTVMTIGWGTGARYRSYNGNIDKCIITETAGIIGAQQVGYESEKMLSVNLDMVIGTSTPQV